MLCTKSINGFTVFVSHPEDCSKFFICHGRRAFPIDCAAGTLFDKNLKICNHAYAVDCQKEPLKAAPTTSETIKTTTETIKIYKEKTDPCLKKGIGINPRNSAIALDPKCEKNLELTIKEPLKAAPTITETVKTKATKTTTTSDKTDPSPCVKKGIGIVPRDSLIDLDPKCEETDLTEDFDYIYEAIFDGPAQLPPCELDIRSLFESDNCDPNLPTTSVGIGFNPRTSNLGG